MSRLMGKSKRFRVQGLISQIEIQIVGGPAIVKEDDDYLGVKGPIHSLRSVGMQT